MWLPSKVTEKVQRDLAGIGNNIRAMMNSNFFLPFRFGRLAVRKESRAICAQF